MVKEGKSKKMSRYPKACLPLLIGIFIIKGCTADIQPQLDDGQLKDGEQDAPQPGTVDEAKPLNEKIEYVIIDLNSLDSALLKEKLDGAQHEPGMIIVEDGGYQYIFLSAGRKPTQGYSLRIGSIEGFDKLIVLDALLYSPCGTDQVEKVATYPTLLIRIVADEREIVMFLNDTRNPDWG